MKFMKLRKCRSCKKTFISSSLIRGCCSADCLEKRKAFLGIRKNLYKKQKKISLLDSQNVFHLVCYMCESAFESKTKRVETPFCSKCRYKLPKKSEYLKALNTWRNLDFKTKEQIRNRVLAKCSYKCMGCYSQRVEALVLDHIIPIRVRPDLVTSIENLQMLCFPCNKTKGVQSNDTFMRKRREYIESRLGK